MANEAEEANQPHLVDRRSFLFRALKLVGVVAAAGVGSQLPNSGEVGASAYGGSAYGGADKS